MAIITFAEKKWLTRIVWDIEGMILCWRNQSSSEPSGEASWSRHQSWTSVTADVTRTANALGGANGGSGWLEPRLDQLEEVAPMLE